MFEYYNCNYTDNNIIDFESPNCNAYNCDLSVISESGGVTNREKSQMEDVLDSYIQKKTVPLVLRKRLMYQKLMLL